VVAGVIDRLADNYYFEAASEELFQDGDVLMLFDRGVVGAGHRLREGGARLPPLATTPLHATCATRVREPAQPGGSDELAVQ
jgi:hypothetical protein